METTTPKLTIHCHPHLNGNTPEDFQAGGRRLYEAAASLRTALTEVGTDVFHGRNYQHLEPAEARNLRELDTAKIRHIHSWLDQIEQIGAELYQRGHKR